MCSTDASITEQPAPAADPVAGGVGGGVGESSLVVADRVLGAAEASLAARVGRAREAAAQVAVWQAELVEAVGECLVEPLLDRPRVVLGYQLGLVPSEIDQVLELCDRLSELPAVRGLLVSGERSLGSVLAIARRADPDNEQTLVDQSEVLTAGALVRMLREYDRVRAPSERESPERDPVDGQSTVRVRRGPGGRHRVTADLDPVDAAELRAALDAAVRRRAGEVTEGDGRSEPIDRSRAVALMDLIGAARSSDGDREGFAADAVQSTLVIHATEDPDDGLRVDRAVLDGDAVPGWMIGMLVERGELTAMVAVDGEPVLAAVEDRYATRLQRRALLARDRGCTFPGCGATRGLIAHHIRHWDQGGPTRLDNMVLVCRHHHRVVHRHHLTYRHRQWCHPDSHPLQPPRLSRPPATRPATDRRTGYHEPLTAYARDVILHNWLTTAA